MLMQNQKHLQFIILSLFLVFGFAVQSVFAASCGSAQWGTYTTAPSTNLCATGSLWTYDPITHDDTYWNWACGSNLYGYDCCLLCLL